MEMFIIIFLICVLLIPQLLINNKEKNDGVILSDIYAIYLGGLQNKIGGKEVYFKLKNDCISINFKDGKEDLIIEKNEIQNASIKTVQQLANDISLSKLFLGISGLKKKNLIDNFLLLNCYKDNEEYKLLFRINKNILEKMVDKINEMKVEQ